MKILRIIAILLGAIIGLIAIGFFAASMKTSARLSARHESHRIDLPVPFPLPEGDSGDALTRAREHGKHLVEARYGCNVCHGKDLAGGVMLDDPAIGTLLGPNLTSGRGGVVGEYTMADWDRIVRHGIKPDGTASLMPSEDFVSMSDHELSDIVAYIRSLPPVAADVALPKLGPIGKILIALGKFPLSAETIPDHQKAHAKEPPAAADTPEFGAHLMATCTTCHRANLAGGKMPFGPPNWPAAANLTLHDSALGSWSFEDFDKAMTQGVSKSGQALREPMSHVIPGTRGMTQTERKALWTYLGTLPKLPMNE